MDRQLRKTNLFLTYIAIAVFVVIMYLVSSATSNQQNTAPQASNATTTVPATVEQPNRETAPTDNASGNLSPSVIAQIEPAIVEVNCYSGDGSMVSSGSGISYTHNGVNLIETNYHVYSEAAAVGLFPTCYAVFPEPLSNFAYNSYYGDYQVALYNYRYNPSTYQDIADFTLESPLSTSVALNHIPTINDFYKSIGPTEAECANSSVDVGDGITVFGYPRSGNLLGISETVTEGIVSGIVPGPIYKTNAAIDHGNSGGLAILNKNACPLGVTTLGDSGLTAGIGYIQSFILANQ
ncbi:S1C family serine protease [Patescibacteria group bacterium]|nr:S1C family serine protease [Patescibacteria group bacterium]